MHRSKNPTRETASRADSEVHSALMTPSAASWGSGIRPKKMRPISRGSSAFSPTCSRLITGEVYVNSLDEGEGHRVREAYGINYTRLVALKAKFDPTNFFRCNHNIPP